MTWQYRKGVPPKHCPIGDVAIEKNFNSMPSLDGVPTLDDDITEYEKSTLAPIVLRMRASSIDEMIPANMASQMVAHLAARTSHMRKTIRMMMTGIAQTANNLFTDIDTVVRLVAVDSLESFERFCHVVVDTIYENPEMTRLSAPRPLVEQFSFWLVREGFNSSFTDHNEVFAAAFFAMRESAKNSAREAHIKALNQGVVSEARVQKLEDFSWRIEASPQGGVILPDCIAIAYDVSGKHDAYMLSSNDAACMIVAPISSGKVLVGRRNDSLPLNLEYLNRHLAECTQDFFVSSIQTPELDALHLLIGARMSSGVDEVMSEAAREFLSERGVFEESEFERIDASDIQEESGSQVSGMSFSLRLFDYGNVDDCERIGSLLSPIVSVIAKHLPMSRLDGFTVAYDPASAIRELDRGFDVPSPVSPSAELGAVWGMSALVLRDGVVKSHIVCSAQILEELENEEIDPRQENLHIIIGLLAEVAATAILDESLPGFLLTPISDTYEAILNQGSGTACIDYLSSYYSSMVGDADEIDRRNQESLYRALVRAQTTIGEARRQCLADRDFDRLLSLSLHSIGNVLKQAAVLVGHRDWIGERAFGWNDSLEDYLTRLELRKWLELFGHDLESFWLNVGSWQSSKEISAFNRHVERLLLQYGVFVSRSEEGLVQVFSMPEEFPTEGGLKVVGPWMTSTFSL